MDFDPAMISYETLLDLFWDSHDAASPAWSRQYMSIIFTQGDAQRRRAIQSRDQEAARTGRAILTEIRPAALFYRAEGYHQKHQLRSERDLLREFTAIYPSERDFVDSTAVARVNGYLGGYGTLPDLQAEMEGLGLSARAGERLRSIVSRRPGRPGCRI